MVFKDLPGHKVNLVKPVPVVLQVLLVHKVSLDVQGLTVDLVTGVISGTLACRVSLALLDCLDLPETLVKQVQLVHRALEVFKDSPEFLEQLAYQVSGSIPLLIDQGHTCLLYQQIKFLNVIGGNCVT